MMAISVGCKVFLREENTIYLCLKREGFIIFSIQQDFNDTNALKPLTNDEMNHNIDLCKQLYSYEVVKKKIKKQIVKILSE